jgi:hypothetical protein
MPITAALSRTLHEALGPEAAADLVDWMQTVDSHRLELRELNELNYARVDSRMNAMDSRFDRMESRLGEFRHEMRAEFSDHRRETQAGLTDLKIAIAGLEARMERRFSDLVKWSFLFWCGAVAAAILARV